MNAKAAKTMIEKRIEAMGIPSHCVRVRVRKVPSRVVAEVIVGGKIVEVEAVSGVLEQDLDYRLGQLDGAWQLHRGGQKDLVVEAQS